MKKKHLRWIIPAGVLVLLASAFFVFVSIYYHADDEAREAIVSDAAVMVSETDYGWLFDGPGEEDALIFYPGAKVEASAYAPLLHKLAEEGMDVCLVKMPFNLAFFDMNRADAVMKAHSYARWYAGGHSLGGAIAASYAAEHGEELTGLILFAAYSTKQLDENLLEISIYGSEDRVLRLDKVEEGRAFAPKDYLEYVIEGGNHAQFGSYGPQKGDGEALISAGEQIRLTVEYIIEHKR